jgi:hypothetical protein
LLQFTHYSAPILSLKWANLAKKEKRGEERRDRGDGKREEKNRLLKI